jgi:hypothetical protein
VVGALDEHIRYLPGVAGEGGGVMRWDDVRGGCVIGFVVGATGVGVGAICYLLLQGFYALFGWR